MPSRHKTSTWQSSVSYVSNLIINFITFNFIALIIAIILATIYLTVKPKGHLIQQFFTVVLVSQIFNFDLLPMSMCGLLGTLASIATNGVNLSCMTDVIKTRDVSGINLPLTVISTINTTIWFLYAYTKGDPFMTMSNSISTIFNSIQLMFYFWAVMVINPRDTPLTMYAMKHLINFFMMFSNSSLANNEIIKLFWQEEDTEAAMAYIKRYKNEIHMLQ